MLPFQSVLLYCWLLGCISIPWVFTQAADPLYATVFLVGPEPQPVIADTTDSPLGSMMNGSSASVSRIYQPLASRSKSNGNRKQALRERRASSVQGSTVPSSLGHESTSDSSDTPLSPRRMRNDNVSQSHKVARTLQGGCNITKTILGFSFSDSQAAIGFGYFPPDPHGAVGVSRLVAVGNSWMEVRQKDGTLTLREGLQSFFSDFSEASDAFTSFVEPKVIYDEHEGRFVMVVLQVDGIPVRSRIWLAVSKGETPDAASDWYKVYINSLVRIGGTQTKAFYPGLEVDEEAVYVTNNMFGSIREMFRGVRLWVISKGVSGGGLYSGAQPSWAVYNPYASVGIPETTMPAQVHGSNGVDGSVGTFFASVVVDSDGSVRLQVYTLFNPLSASPSYIFQTTRLGVISQEFPIPDAPQLGTTAKLDSGDYRALDAVWRNNKLWVVFMFVPTSGVNQGQATAHWVRLATSGGSVTLEAQGDLGGEDIAAGTHTFYPSVAVNSRGVVAYGYSASSPTTYAGAYVSVGTSEKSYTVKSGLDPYARTFGSRNRWGDYSGIAVDPTDDSFWIFNEYADTRGSADPSGEDGRWGTAVARLACDAPPLTAPSPAPIPDPQDNPPTIPIESPACGLLGLSVLCPLSFCGLFGRLLGLCRS